MELTWISSFALNDIDMQSDVKSNQFNISSISFKIFRHVVDCILNPAGQLVQPLLVKVEEPRNP